VLALAIASVTAGCGDSGGGDGAPEFGEAADGGQQAEAERALTTYLDARAAGNWQAACGQLAADLHMRLARFGAVTGQGEGGGCAAAMETFTAKAARSIRREQAEVEVGELRVKGKQGHLSYTDAESVPLSMPLLREGGEWKVNALLGAAGAGS
jgi:hypothetical protein